MALSDTFTKNIGSYNRLRLVWTASQNAANNTSTITSKLYWEATRSGVGPIYSSSSRSASVRINGNTGSATTNAYLSAGQSRLIKTHTVTVPHNSDGSKSVAISGTFDLSGISISGTNYGSQTVSGTADLNDIPRESSLASAANWTAGDSLYLSISRATSSFTHQVRVYVNNTLIKTVYDVGYGASTSFSLAEHTAIFAQLNGATSRATRIDVLTYSGNTYIGTTSRTGTVTSPNASYVRSLNGEMTQYNNTRDVYTDQTIAVSISRASESHTHTLKFYSGTTLIKTVTGIGGSYNWVPSTAEKTAIHNTMKTARSAKGNIEVTTYYNGRIVRSATDNDINFYIRNAAPTLSAGAITYRDTNSVSIAVTGNNQQIIQNVSDLSVTLTAAATGLQGATIAKYDVTVNGVTKSAATTASAFVFGKVSASSSAIISVKVTDSRGFTVTTTKDIILVPYSPPRVTLEAERLNGFEKTVTVGVGGTLTPLANNTNYIKTATLSYRNRATNVTAGTTSLSTSGYPKFNAVPVVYTMDNQTAFDVIVSITDVLSTTTQTVVVEAGRPIVFIDSEKGSVGIGDFPSGLNELFLNGRLVFGSTSWSGGGIVGDGEGSGAIDMNNGDIVRANGIYFNDLANNNGEGLMFAKTGTPAGFAFSSGYDSQYLRDARQYVNGQYWFHVDTSGVFHRSSYKEPNGMNTATIYAPSNYSGQMLLQYRHSSFDVNDQSFVDITFPTAFDSAPDWVLVSGKESNSVGFNMTAYSITATGCRVYAKHVESYVGTFRVTFNVVAAGRKS